MIFFALARGALQTAKYGKFNFDSLNFPKESESLLKMGRALLAHPSLAAWRKDAISQDHFFSVVRPHMLPSF